MLHAPIRHTAFVSYAVCLLVCFAFLISGPAAAATIIPASDNATVQPGGPRSGTNGKIFFDVEGSSNGTFASFGVIDFQTPAGTTFVSGEFLSLTLTQSNASFTHNGSLAFYLSTDTATNIQPGTSPLVYNAAAAPTGISSQLSSTYLLGTGLFTQIANGQMDTFTFAPSGTALTYLMNEVGTAGKLRLLVASQDATVSATYAGYSNTTASTPGPVLRLTPAGVPEPSTVLLEAAGLLLVGLYARRARSCRARP